MKKKYYIQFYDRYGNTKHAIIKAKDEEKAEKDWYKRQPYTLIVKISLV